MNPFARKSYKCINGAWLPILCGILLVPGCASNPRGEVYRDWTKNFSELGIFPVFPPREDIVVGDVYLLPMHPLNSYMAGHVGGLGMTGIHIGYYNWTTSNDLPRLLGDYYRERPSFPITPPTAPAASGTTNSTTSVASSGTNNSANHAANATASTTDKSPDNSASDPVTNSPSAGQDVPTLQPPDTRTNVFEGLEPNRLREVVFPEFSFSTISEASAAAMVPVEYVMVNAGFDVSKVTQVTVKIPKAESYGITTDRLLTDFFVKDIWIKRGQSNSPAQYYLRADEQGSSVLDAAAGPIAREMFSESLRTSVDDNYPWWKHLFTHNRLISRVAKDAKSLYVGLVTEVFYARAINLSISGTRSSAFGAAAAPVGPNDIAKWMALGSGTTTNTTTTSTNSGGTNSTVTSVSVQTTSGAGTNQDPFVIADKLRNMNLGSTNGIGGNIRVLGVSQHTVGLQRTFEHPVAVGVRGVLLKIDATPVSVPPGAVSAGGVTNTTGFQGYRIATSTPL